MQQVEVPDEVDSGVFKLVVGKIYEAVLSGNMVDITILIGRKNKQTGDAWPITVQYRDYGR